MHEMKRTATCGELDANAGIRGIRRAAPGREAVGWTSGMAPSDYIGTASVPPMERFDRALALYLGD